jgi:hypothetical protein
VLIALVLAAIAGAAEPELRFTGVMGSGKEVRIALKNPTSDRSAWAAVGDTFEGYSVRRYEAASDTVVVAKGGAEFRLHLVDAKVQAGERELPPEVHKRILNNLRQLSAAADQFFLEHGVMRVTYDQLVGPGKDKYIRAIVPVDGEDYRSISFEQGKPLTVRTAGGHVVSFQN